MCSLRIYYFAVQLNIQYKERENQKSVPLKQEGEKSCLQYLANSHSRERKRITGVKEKRKKIQNLAAQKNVFQMRLKYMGSFRSE